MRAEKETVGVTGIKKGSDKTVGGLTGEQGSETSGSRVGSRPWSPDRSVKSV